MTYEDLGITERTEMAQRARQAAEYVEAGWTKNIFEDERGNVCALGALNKSFTGDANTGPRGRISSQYVEIRDLTTKELTWGWIRFFQRKTFMDSLISTNDRSRSGKRIARAFRRVAAKLDPDTIPLKTPVTQRDMELAGGPES